MPKLMTLLSKRKMISLINENKSLNEISRITGLPKTTIYYHYRKCKGKQIIPVQISRSNPELLGEFIGAVAGDGYINRDSVYNYRTRIFLGLGEMKYAEDLCNALATLFGKSPHKYTDRKGHTIQISFISKDIFDLVKEYLYWESKGHRSKSRSVRLKKSADSEEFKIGFLRGCIDTDGYISKSNVQFSTASRGLSENIRNFLQDIGIEFSVYTYQDKRPNKSLMYHIRIATKHRQKFIDAVSPRNL